MQNLLPKTLALLLMTGGFAATGDLAWVTGLGVRLVNARTIPTEDRPQQAAPEAPLPPMPAAHPLPSAAPALAPATNAAVFRDPLPPATCSPQIQLDSLSPGDRLIVWLAAPAVATAQQPWIAFDLIDPVRLEAIAHGGSTSPRRVRLRVLAGRGTGTVLAKGSSLLVTPIGIAHAPSAVAADGEVVGPIAAFTVAEAE